MESVAFFPSNKRRQKDSFLLTTFIQRITFLWYCILAVNIIINDNEIYKTLIIFFLLQNSENEILIEPPESKNFNFENARVCFIEFYKYKMGRKTASIWLLQSCVSLITVLYTRTPHFNISNTLSKCNQDSLFSTLFPLGAATRLILGLFSHIFLNPNIIRYLLRVHFCISVQYPLWNTYIK